MAVDGSHKDRLEDSSGRKQHSFPFAKTHRILWPEMAVTTTGSRTALGKTRQFPPYSKASSHMARDGNHQNWLQDGPPTKRLLFPLLQSKNNNASHTPARSNTDRSIITFCFMHKHPHDCQDEYTMLMNRNMIYIYIWWAATSWHTRIQPYIHATYDKCIRAQTHPLANPSRKSGSAAEAVAFK